MMTFDQYEAGLTAAIDGAFTEPDLYMRDFLLKHVLEMKWMRAALLQGMPLKGPAHDDQ